MTRRPVPAAPEPGVLGVVRGNPTEEELAAALVALMLLGRRSAGRAAPSAWHQHARRSVLRHSLAPPVGWRPPAGPAGSGLRRPEGAPVPGPSPSAPRQAPTSAKRGTRP
ncbi:acyl-CoA carboxylase epsilon subunit [Kitasatospora sp. NPDC005856]|uniref:acyl-CoA carboxylase epsilon subunit n=1 Tax=Kitasatospora sp. NPDC005856 TaxID=3154566 RepID=UPI0033D37AD6